MGYEHSLMFDSSLIPAYEQNWDVDTAHEDGFESNLTFAEDGTPKGGASAQTLDVIFSSGKTTSFEYDTQSRLYKAYEYGTEYIDAENDQQVSFTNVIALFASVYNIAGDDKGRLDIETTGEGTGYFACGGQCIPITWQRESGGQFEYYLENGTELVLGVGSSYIAVIPDGSSVEFA